MSVKISGLVWDRYQGVGNEFVLALAIADHSHDDGSHIFPSVSRLAKKARISERTVQRILLDMKKSGWLVKVSSGLGGRNFTTEYKINPNWVKGDNLSPFILEEERVTPQVERVTNDALKGDIAVSLKGDIAVSPEPSLTNTNHQESSPRARDASKISDDTKQKMSLEGELACWLIPLNVKVQSINPTLIGWVKDGFTKQHISECLAIARQHKPLPEFIPANYLDRIIREKPKPKKTQDAWWLSDKATEAKANELGIKIKRGESWADLRTRMRQLIEKNDDEEPLAA